MFSLLEDVYFCVLRRLHNSNLSKLHFQGVLDQRRVVSEELVVVVFIKPIHYIHIFAEIDHKFGRLS